jgi:Predicted nucleotide-binding protein containing TIR-like domain
MNQRTERTPHDARHGVIDVAPRFSAFRNSFADTIDDVRKAGFKCPLPPLLAPALKDHAPENKYSDLADTFLSDTIPLAGLEELLKAAIANEITTRVLLLNPVSPEAVARAIELADAAAQSVRTIGEEAVTDGAGRRQAKRIAHGNLKRSFRGLAQLYQALRNAVQEPETGKLWESSPENKALIWGLPERLPDIDDAEDVLEFYDRELRALSELLTKVKFPKGSRSGKPVVEVKMTDENKDMPLFIVGHFAYRGILTPGKSAADSPWLYLIDDPYQPQDIYSTYRDCFEAAWKKATPLADMAQRGFVAKKTIMIAYSEKNRRAVETFRDQFLRVTKDYELVYFDCDPYDPYSVTEEVWGKLERSSAGIVLMLNDEKLNGKFRSRPNVIHELGLFQAKFGRSRVLTIREPGEYEELGSPKASGETYTAPSNTNDDKYVKIRRDADGGLSSDDVWKALERFIKRLEKVSH